jgi:hypothetical protein
MGSMENDDKRPLPGGTFTRRDKKFVGTIKTADMQGATDKPVFLRTDAGGSSRYRGHRGGDDQTKNKSSHMLILSCRNRYDISLFAGKYIFFVTPRKMWTRSWKAPCPFGIYLTCRMAQKKCSILPLTGKLNVMPCIHHRGGIR